MNIAAVDLKHALKKLSSVKSENYQIGSWGVLAQDSDVCIAVACPLNGLGTRSINGKKFSSVVNRMTGQIEITPSEKSLVLKSSKARVELETQTIKEFVFPENPKNPFSIELKEFKAAVADAAVSASTNKAADFGGVVQVRTLPLGLEDSSPSGYRVVGTDGIALTVVMVKKSVSSEFSLLLNLTAADALRSLDGENIIIGDIGVAVYLKCGDTTIYASKPVKEYPVFDSLINVPAKIKISLKPEEWLSALKTIDPLIDDTVDQGGVSGHFKDGVVKWETLGVGSTASDESSYEQIEPDPIFEPKDFTLRIKSKYLAASLLKAGDDSVLSRTDINKPVKLESGRIMILTMPLRGSK